MGEHFVQNIIFSFSYIETFLWKKLFSRIWNEVSMWDYLFHLKSMVWLLRPLALHFKDIFRISITDSTTSFLLITLYLLPKSNYTLQKIFFENSRPLSNNPTFPCHFRVCSILWPRQISRTFEILRTELVLNNEKRRVCACAKLFVNPLLNKVFEILLCGHK